ncbi:hypothetical protein H5410_053559 [Solanum commersonii]|uniref:Uncharacterized protein n=2 Tax=Solanum TaxID=4107 RepID=A0ABQ7WFI3_SOLTU|nr:uncharacterized protein LOC125806813 [Solanum verrucosum]KAG5582932.1 hypothetical protein H5410_053559 [Solanum commersonii]KAH0720889.1 hypothetical protein KY284_005919 [Solanum tuberosum]KAH0779484.1 hypothetical protein KY290_005911 [Solanum tuberosum]
MAEFLKMNSPAIYGGRRRQLWQSPRVVDSVSCRQLYLRSAYTFSRKETVPQKTKKCLGKVRERVANGGKKKGKIGRRRRRVRSFTAVRRVKKICCAALCGVFRKLLACTATVDVVDHES